MEETDNASMDVLEEENKKDEKRIGRRRLLKTLIASGGVVALTGLPTKWTKPVVEAGELSAHAQASPIQTGIQLVGPLTIRVNTTSDSTNLPKCIYMASCAYKDASQSITTGNTSAEGKTSCESNVTTIVKSISPEKALAGAISFQFSAGLCNTTNPEYSVRISSNGQTSNWISAGLPPCIPFM